MKGLLDAGGSAEFDDTWAYLEQRWHGRGQVGQQFKKYMVTHKQQLTRKCMTAEVRKRCGLGDLPSEYNQNANECMNGLLKQGMEKKKLSIKETINLIQEQVSSQEERLKLAIIGKGEWNIRQEYKKQLEVTEEKYYRLTDVQRVQ